MVAGFVDEFDRKYPLPETEEPRIILGRNHSLKEENRINFPRNHTDTLSEKIQIDRAMLEKFMSIESDHAFFFPRTGVIQNISQSSELTVNNTKIPHDTGSVIKFGDTIRLGALKIKYVSHIELPKIGFYFAGIPKIGRGLVDEFNHSYPLDAKLEDMYVIIGRQAPLGGIQVPPRESDDKIWEEIIRIKRKFDDFDELERRVQKGEQVYIDEANNIIPSEGEQAIYYAYQSVSKQHASISIRKETKEITCISKRGMVVNKINYGYGETAVLSDRTSITLGEPGLRFVFYDNPVIKTTQGPKLVLKSHQNQATMPRMRADF